MYITKIINLSKEKAFVVALIILFINIFLFNNIFAANYIYDISNKKSTKEDQSSISTIATPEFNFQSVAQILMEPTTGKIIYANNENEKLLPASVTKVMTMLLIMEHIDSGKLSYDDKISCSAKASGMGGSQIWFKEGEELTVDEALKAIAVVSANDVTVAMAEHIGGSEENFVKMMNEKAKELGMENTNFMNSHGIDEENHYTSAKDIAIMSRELINNHPDILKYTSIWMDTLRDGTFELSSTNKLIRFYEGATGLKTGSTSQALFNLSGTATRNNTTFIAVVMKAPSSDIRLAEIKQLLDYGFATYEVQSICDKDTIIESKSINKNVNEIADIVVKDSITTLVQKGEKIETSQNLIYNNELYAPLNLGDVVGTMQIINNSNGQVIGESELIINRDIPKSNFLEYFKKIFKLYLMSQIVE